MGSPLITWSCKHTSWLQNRFQLHDDGKTSYERRWHQTYSKPIADFGEAALFHLMAGVPTKTSNRWELGIWLGRCTQSDEHFVGLGEVVYRTTSIRRLPRSEKYQRHLLEKLVAVPWKAQGIGHQQTPNWHLKPSLQTQNY